MVTRRTTLKGIGAGLISGAIPAAALATSSTEKIPDVVVIGAGMSGLYAAMLLEGMGATVQVVEGRSRVGGRVHTNFNLPGHPEMGANTLAGGYARVISVAKQLGVELIDYSPRFFSGPPPELVVDKTVIPAQQWPESALNPFSQQYRQAPPSQIISMALRGKNPLPTASDWFDPKYAYLDVPLRQYLGELGLSSAEIALAYDENPYTGFSASDVSALFYLHNSRWIEEQMKFGTSQYAVKGGNQKLPQAMAASLKSEVWLNKNVRQIDTSSTPVVRFHDGTETKARHVICSTPLSKLRDIELSHKLEGLQHTAASAIKYMRVSTALLIPRSPFWEKDGLSPSMWTNGLASSLYAQKFNDNPDEITGLMASVRGWNADKLDRLSTEQAGAALIREIEQIRPAAKGQLELGTYHSWGKDPFAAGSWSVPGPGQVSTLLPNIAAPHGKIHFCGEHTATTQRGMEGAMESAERVAIELATVI